MKEIKPDELFANLTSFLKGKGIELTGGSYSGRIRQGCDLLTDAVNLTQAGLAKAKAGIDEKLDRMRQLIHEKTAPKPPPAAGTTKPAASPVPQAVKAKARRTPAKRRVAARKKAR